MGATSVTGKGHGEAKGPNGIKPSSKRELHSGCGSGPPPKDSPAPKPVKTGCFTKQKAGGSIVHKSGGNSGIKVC